MSISKDRSVIYAIQNKIDQKAYVGSALNFKQGRKHTPEHTTKQIAATKLWHAKRKEILEERGKGCSSFVPQLLPIAF